MSEIGHCPRKAMLRLKGVPETDPFDPYVRRLLWSGKMAEAKLEEALHAEMEVEDQVRVENDVFRGTIDFLLPGFAIVEHKETGYNNFKYKRLPYDFHLLQVLAYADLYEGPEVDAILYYQNRADWAEFRAWEANGGIHYEGKIKDKKESGDLDTTLGAEMEKLAQWYREDEIPDRYETPFEKNFECTSMYKKYAYSGCVYWSECWPEHADERKLEIPKEMRK